MNSSGMGGRGLIMEIKRFEYVETGGFTPTN